MTLRDMRFWHGWLVVLTLFVGMANMVDLPMEPHETFVVRTVEEMHDRGDFVVPYLNDRPRLNKPPLNYWLTAVVADIAGDLNRVAPWEGRFVSVLAGGGLVALSGALGTALASPAIGLMAAAIAASSYGTFYYTHSARPEMLYAFWCALGLLGFVRAWQATDARHRGRWVLGMWTAYALACLTKGPQLPVMLVLACVAFVCLHAPLRSQTLALLRPLSGLLIIVALNVPWWYAVGERVGQATLENSQLGGALLRPGLLDGDPYYFYRTWQLVLPWVALLPALIALRRIDPVRRPALVWLGLVVAVPAVMLSFGPQERWYYMLPVLPALAVVLSIAAERFWTGERLRRWMPVWLLGHGLLTLVGVTAVGLLYRSRLDLPAGGLLLIVGLTAWAWHRHRRRGGLSLPGAMLITANLFMITTASLAFSPRLWGTDRYAEREAAGRLARLVAQDEPLVSWRTDLTNLIYYLDRPIPRAERVSDLQRFETRWVLAPNRTVTTLMAAVPVAGHCALDAGDEFLWLVRIGSPADAPVAAALSSPDCDPRPLPAPGR
jgi:4-amino-4-deoxy-L-arabinose transferase-like glycosyltransferase